MLRYRQGMRQGLRPTGRRRHVVVLVGAICCCALWLYAIASFGDLRPSLGHDASVRGVATASRRPSGGGGKLESDSDIFMEEEEEEEEEEEAAAQEEEGSEQVGPATVPRAVLGQTCPRDFVGLSFDPYDRYIELTEEQVEAAIARNPLDCVAGTARKGIQEVYVPATYYSSRRERYIFGGFTADMGWPLMIARYVMRTSEPGAPLPGVQFQSEWGHGCPMPAGLPISGWQCFFKQITPTECVAQNSDVVTRFWETKHEGIRHKVKMYDILDDDNPGPGERRNERLVELAGLSGVLPPDNDLQIMRIAFRWVYRLQPFARRQVDKQHKALARFTHGNPYVALHIRWGDKIGRGGGPTESTLIPLVNYVKAIECYYGHQGRDEVPRFVYIATDDYQSVVEMRALLGPRFSVHTSASPKNTGFSITKYHSGEMTERDKYGELLRLWADMEMLAGAELFVGNMESSIGMMVNLMRLRKHPRTTINAMGIHRGQRSCCAKRELAARKVNCFWTCP